MNQISEFANKFTPIFIIDNVNGITTLDNILSESEKSESGWTTNIPNSLTVSEPTEHKVYYNAYQPKSGLDELIVINYWIPCVLNNGRWVFKPVSIEFMNMIPVRMYFEYTDIGTGAWYSMSEIDTENDRPIVYVKSFGGGMYHSTGWFIPHTFISSGTKIMDAELLEVNPDLKFCNGLYANKHPAWTTRQEGNWTIGPISNNTLIFFTIILLTVFIAMFIISYPEEKIKPRLNRA